MSEEVEIKVQEFITLIIQNKITSSYNIARKTVLLLREIVSKSKWSNPRELIERIRKDGKRIIQAQPGENAVCNMVRRVLKIIREELVRCVRGLENTDTKDSYSLHTMLKGGGDSDDLSKPVPNLKGSVIEAIHELLVEMEESANNISAQALDHIHSNEVIMTVGHSKTVEAFLKGAARKRSFHVIVAESAPFYHGQQLARNLAEAKIETTVITDSAVFALMSRVIIGTHTVMADGGQIYDTDRLKALNGVHSLAVAAKHHSVPVIVCAAMFKLSPKFLCSYDQDTFNKIVSPHDLIQFNEVDLISKVHIQNPVFDYVPPDLINLFISNIGGNPPSYVYRLISELYDADDNDL